MIAPDWLPALLAEHAPTTSGIKGNVECRPECGWAGNDYVAHRAHVAQAIRESGAK